MWLSAPFEFPIGLAGQTGRPSGLPGSDPRPTASVPLSDSAACTTYQESGSGRSGRSGGSGGSGGSTEFVLPGIGGRFQCRQLRSGRAPGGGAASPSEGGDLCPPGDVSEVPSVRRPSSGRHSARRPVTGVHRRAAVGGATAARPARVLARFGQGRKNASASTGAAERRLGVVTSPAEGTRDSFSGDMTCFTPWSRL